MSRIVALSVVIISASLVCAAAGTAGEPDPASVSTEWLAAHLDDAGLVILDARPSLRDYLAGHVPGAQPLGVENVRSAAGGVPGQLFAPEVLSAIARRLGITPGGRVVVYGAENDPDATFVASAFRLSGLPGVFVLEGGLKRWSQEGRPTTAARRPVKESEVRLQAGTPDLASLDDVRRAVQEKSAVLVDARPREQYEAGRLPGAVSRFWKGDLVPEGRPDAGRLRDAADLEKEYAGLGVTKDTPAIVYCNTGHMASEVFYTLRYRLGYTRVKLYDGSWVEWSMHPDLPRESGPAGDRSGDR